MSESTAGPSRGGVRRWRAWIAVALAVAGAVLVGWWVRGVVMPDASLEATAETGRSTSAEVVEVSVGEARKINVTVTQPVEMVAVNHLSGVVTSTAAGRVKTGDTIYTVGSVPVVVTESSRPFYRDLARGARGGDVEALGEAMRALGYLELEPSEMFGSDLQDAVLRWQRDTGQPRTGTVLLGQVVALPDLPAAVGFGDEIAPGLELAGGEKGVQAPAGDRDFSLVLSESQRQVAPVGATVTVPYEDEAWQAVVTDVSTDDEGRVIAKLAAPEGGPVCGDDCADLPAAETTSILSEVESAPPVEGAGVPTAAIRTRADGTTYVVLQDGSERDITVVGSGQGVSVVDGVDLGETVQLDQVGVDAADS